MYHARLTVTVNWQGSPDDDAARLALAQKLREVADRLEKDARPAPAGAADGCGLCWYVDQLSRLTEEADR